MRGSGLSPACSETLVFHPISAAQPGGAARGVKAGEEFGEARAALIRSERPSQGSKANPKFTSWGHGLDSVPFWGEGAPWEESEVSPSFALGGPEVALQWPVGSW